MKLTKSQIKQLIKEEILKEEEFGRLSTGTDSKEPLDPHRFASDPGALTARDKKERAKLSQSLCRKEHGTECTEGDPNLVGYRGYTVNQLRCALGYGPWSATREVLPRSHCEKYAGQPGMTVGKHAGFVPKAKKPWQAEDPTGKGFHDPPSSDIAGMPPEGDMPQRPAARGRFDEPEIPQKLRTKGKFTREQERLRRRINKLHKGGKIDKATWRRARNALYKGAGPAMKIITNAIGGASGGSGAGGVAAALGVPLEEGRPGMTLTKSQLKQIIQEELKAALNELNEGEGLGCVAALAEKFLKSGRTRNPAMARRMAENKCRLDSEAHKK